APEAPVTSETLQAVAAPAKKQTAFPPPRYRAPRYRFAGEIKTAPAKTAVVNKGFHLVLASFKNPANANRFALKNPGLKTRLAKAWVKGRPMYRVVVGPLAPEDRIAMRAHLASIGLRGAWPVHLDGSAAASQLAEAR
ncbi:MAG TPA: SPOR domain-containing protein, partial [Rhodospirillales bacterium]|nr:SPOR domain-containing protein [Rhodospirillales bacterium]